LEKYKSYGAETKKKKMQFVDTVKLFTRSQKLKEFNREMDFR
jgi:predicted methyltransferase MtxX (methanogen marker protein 4)